MGAGAIKRVLSIFVRIHTVVSSFHSHEQLSCVSLAIIDSRESKSRSTYDRRLFEIERKFLEDLYQSPSH